MKKEDVKFSQSDILEGMPSISALIKAIEQEKSDRRIIRIFIDERKKSSKRKEIGFLRAKASLHHFSIDWGSSEEISRLTVGTSHGGIIALCTGRTLLPLTEDRICKEGVYFMLEGVEDPYNFGYAVRSLYASGADGIILPPRNWMGTAGVVARSSAGASELMDMYVAEPTEAVAMFAKAGYRILCAGIRDSVSLFTADLSKPLLVILGGEKRGISGALLSKADQIVRIDYGTEFQGSLSTAAATAVFAFEILRYNSEIKNIYEKSL